MRTTLLLLALLAGPVLASQTVWKWVDEKGVTHYSDRSVPGATRMDIGGGKSGNSSASGPSDSDYSPPPPPAASGPPYRNFEIWKPSNEETFVNTGAAITVNIRVEPALQLEHSLALYLDNVVVEGYPGNTLTFELNNVARGIHRLNAVITDTTGKRLQEAAPVTFIVRQESVAQPPVGPAMRPPPRPRGNTVSNKPLTAQPTYAMLNRIPQTPIDPVTNKPVVTKPAPKPTGPKVGN